MKFAIKLVTAITLTLTCLTSFAVPRVLGFEMGIANAAQVKLALSTKTTITNVGINKYSGGPMLATDGSSYGVEGLSRVLYVFDSHQRLAAVLMTMSDASFDQVFDVLSKKYRVVEQVRPFVGDKFARFTAGNTTIELDAPHMSFDMAVRYLRNDFRQAVVAQTAAEEAAKTKTEAAAF